MKQMQTPRMSLTVCEDTSERVMDAIEPPSGAYYRIQCRPDDSPDPA